MDTEFSPALNLAEFMSFIHGGTGERRKITMLELNRPKTMTTAKQKSNLQQPSRPCEPCSPWETPDPSCEPSQLLCRWKANLLQMSWHRPKIPRSPTTSYGACANELPIVHLWQLPVLRMKITTHLMGMKPKVAQLCCTAVSVEILGVSTVLLNLPPHNHLLFYP